jgi:hypothetical protein
MRNLIIIFAIATIGIFSSAFPAFSLDTSAPLLCSVTKAIECTTENSCIEGTAETYDLPQFVKVDLQGKKIIEVGENTLKRESEIKNLQQINNTSIIQGIENGRSWSVVIGDEGKMSAAVSESGVGFIVFGACISL